MIMITIKTATMTPTINNIGEFRKLAAELTVEEGVIWVGVGVSPSLL